MAQVKNYLTYQRLANALAKNSGQDERKNHWIKFEAIDDGLIKVVHQSFVSAGHQSVKLELQRKWRLDALIDIQNRMKKIEEDYAKLSEIADNTQILSKNEYSEPAKKKISLEIIDSSIQETSDPLSYQIYSVQKTSVYKVFALIRVK
jgi:hypothetical protein